MWVLGGYPGDERGVDQFLEQKPEYAKFKQTRQEFSSWDPGSQSSLK